MGKKRRQFTKEFKVEAVRLIAEEGRRNTEVSRELGISEALLGRWKKKYGGLGVLEIPKLKQLAADLSLDKKMLQDVLSKKL